MATAPEIHSLKSLRDSLAGYIEKDRQIKHPTLYVKGRVDGYGTAVGALDSMAGLYGWWPVDGSVQ